MEHNGFLIDTSACPISQSLTDEAWKQILNDPTLKSAIDDYIAMESVKRRPCGTTGLTGKCRVDCLLSESASDGRASYAQATSTFAEYTNSQTERERESYLGMQSFSKSTRPQFEEVIAKFSRHAQFFEIYDPMIGETAAKGKASRDRFSKGVGYVAGLILANSIQGSIEITVITKDTDPDSRNRLEDSLRLEFTTALRTFYGKICIRWTSRDFHDRFLTNDRYLCSFGKGFDIVEQAGLTDLNVFFCGSKSKVGNFLTDLKKNASAPTTLWEN